MVQVFLDQQWWYRDPRFAVVSANLESHLSTAFFFSFSPYSLLFDAFAENLFRECIASRSYISHPLFLPSRIARIAILQVNSGIRSVNVTLRELSEGIYNLGIFENSRVITSTEYESETRMKIINRVHGCYKTVNTPGLVSVENLAQCLLDSLQKLDALQPSRTQDSFIRRQLSQEIEMLSLEATSARHTLDNQRNELSMQATLVSILSSLHDISC